MDQEYRALLADLEEHAVSECKAARQLAKAAEALALVAVVDGEGDGDWGVWSGLCSSFLAQSHLRLAICKTQAPAAEVRQRAPSVSDTRLILFRQRCPCKHCTEAHAAAA
jgi:hypothetical protein